MDYWKVNKLTFVHDTGMQDSHSMMALFSCDCGEYVEVIKSRVKNGYTKSCGCSIGGRSHYMSQTLFYKKWSAMKARCYNKKNKSYINYGGRGIIVCDRWLNSFENYLKDIGERPSKKHSLDRIDNDGPYSPENCRWATREEQNTNKRNNVFLTAYGVTQTISEWAKTLEVPVQRIGDRVRRGYSHHDALFLPKLKSNLTFDLQHKE